MKNRSVSARVLLGLLLAVVSIALSACGDRIYYYTQYQYAGRAVPPSGILQRVLVGYTSNGSSGGLQILDGLRDIRTNVQDTIQGFQISGYSGAQPSLILNFPEQTSGYVLSANDGSLTAINYAKESSSGGVASFGAFAPSAAASPDGTRFAGANEASGALVVAASGVGPGTFTLNLPNVYKVAMNRGNSVILAMVRNSNTLYRIVKIPASNVPTFPPGYVDCEPLNLPVYCVVPVAGSYDRPTDAYFSSDGNTAFILNCGPECGGTTASVTALNASALIVDNIPMVSPLSAGAPSPMETLPVANPIPIPGGVTVAQSDGTRLYLAGQSLFSLGPTGALGTTPRVDGLFTGFLTAVDLTSFAVSNPVSISDGTHTRLLLADDNTLWAGSSQCASGERKAQGLNYNCLTRISLAGNGLSAQIFPNVTPGGNATVPYPNSTGDLYYYGSLTGICWVQQYHKVYTAYGGQIHAFSTVDGSEINNTNITVQGTVLDVAYMDALTNAAN